MKWLNKFRFNWIFLLVIVIFGLYWNLEYNVFAQPDLALKDDHLEVYIELDGQNIWNATNKVSAIQIYPKGEVYGKVICGVIGNDTVYVDKIEIGFIVMDRDVFTIKKKDINVYLNFGDELLVNETFIFQDVLGIENINLMSGIYQLKYYLYYDVANSSKVLEVQPFYMNLLGNPLTSVTGIVSTAAVAISGVSTIGLVNSMRKSIPLEIGNSIDNTYVKATDKLRNYYEGKFFKGLQNEVSNIAFGYAKTWKAEICPVCKLDWPEGGEVCPGCNTIIEEAREIFAKALEERSLMISKEIVDSGSTLSVYGITEKLGEGIIPTTSIISVLIGAGLSIAEPRVVKSWNVKTRKLFFRGLSTALISVLWVQAIGFGVVSISMLAVAILTATIPSLIISKILENMIKVKTKLFWG